MFFKMDVLKNVVKFTGKHICWSNEVAGHKTCNFIKRKVQHRCFSVKFAEFLRTLFFTELLQGLLLHWLEMVFKISKV